MIPKILHYIWFGKNPLTPLASECLDSRKATMPDWRNWAIIREIVNALAQMKRFFMCKG